MNLVDFTRLTEEWARRRAICDAMDTAAYDCTGILAAFVDSGRIKHPTAIKAVAAFREAVAVYEAVDAMDKASGSSPARFVGPQ